MKPALFYALHNHYGSYRAVAVTSESKSSWRNQWHGRDLDRDNMPTHGRLTELIGRFDTEDQARSVVNEIKAIKADCAREREPLHTELRIITRKEKDRIDRALANAVKA